MKTAPAFWMCSMLRRSAVAVVLLLSSALPASAQTETIEYYGLDQLGSVRVIFDQNGQQIERMNYGPFGENLKAAIKMAFEQYAELARDAETGQDYAQARSYSPAVGRFNRVDPIYAGLLNPQYWNRYTYAANRPLTLTDPTGLCPPKDNKPCDFGFTETVSVSATISGLRTAAGGGRGHPEDELLGDQPQPGSENQDIGPIQLGIEWLTGTGPVDGVRVFREGDRITEDLRRHPHVNEIRKLLASRCSNDNFGGKGYNYSLSGLEGIPKYLRDYSTVATFGMTGNLTVTYLGSFVLKGDTSVTSPGKVTINFTASNPSSIGSALRFPVVGYLPGWRKYVADPMTKVVDWFGGPMSSTKQIISWTETVQCGQ